MAVLSMSMTHPMPHMHFYKIWLGEWCDWTMLLNGTVRLHTATSCMSLDCRCSSLLSMDYPSHFFPFCIMVWYITSSIYYCL